tara:strand:+ start:334 stop:768 length:435 start_codon:yes stop_codon:yes gene_type:complete
MNTLRQIKNTNKPNYVINKDTGEETKTIAMEPCEPWKDKDGNWHTEKQSYSDEYTQNIEMRFNSTDKAIVPKLLSVAHIEALTKLNEKLQFKADTEYECTSLVEVEHTEDDETKTKGLKAIFKPKWNRPDYSAFTSFDDLLAMD